MKKVLTQALLVSGLAIFALGCAPEAEKVCSKLKEIYKGSPDTPSWLKTDDACIESMESRKSRKGVNSYRRYAECIFQSDGIFDTKRCADAEEDPRDK